MPELGEDGRVANASPLMDAPTRDQQERFRQLGADGGGGPPEQLTAFVKSELAKYSKVIKDAGIKAE